MAKKGTPAAEDTTLVVDGGIEEGVHQVLRIGDEVRLTTGTLQANTLKPRRYTVRATDERKGQE